MTISLAAALLGTLGACASAPTGTATRPTPAPATEAPRSSPTTRPTDPPTPLVADPTLLAVLPAEVDGHPLRELPDAEAGVLADPALARSAERLALGSVSSGDGRDWAIAWVVALRPGVYPDAMWRGWRDTFDEEACASVGGPGGHAETTLGGRPVAITTCGSIVVHHVHLGGPDRLVAVTSAGPGRFGERIVADLHP